ncbi:hypothetical protein Tco_0679210 [Tanacetum coccineum]|uniref:Uncharacterized protein n=1 Tax=Tanacetum coccineum TaxID=301880 RepID=A0ABQ4XH94_9ASTR
MAPLPPREQRHPFFRYQGLECTDADITDFEERLERIYTQEIHRVQVVDFQGMPELMRDGLFPRMAMEHHDDDVLVRWSQETFELEAVYSGLGITLQGGDGVPRFCWYWSDSERMIPGKGYLHDYWRGISTDGDFLGPPPSYTLIRDLMLRLFHMMMAYNIAGRSQAPEKVTVTDLFYLRWLDVGSVNIPYLLARYLRRFAAGRKSRAHISRGHLIILGVGGHGRKRGSPMLLIVAPTVAEVAPAVLMRVKWHSNGTFVGASPAALLRTCQAEVLAMPVPPQAQLGPAASRPMIPYPYLLIKPGSKFSTIVHEYVTEPSRIFTPKEKNEEEGVIPSVWKLKKSLT